MENKIVFKNIIKKYGENTVINDVSFVINPGELFTLLGPSGCGKTTLLRMVAGFNTIEGGQIYFGEQIINDIPPHKRNTGMVFQNYAIFPHITVRENIAYGLKARNIVGKELKDRVTEAMQMVQIEEYQDRSPTDLSGGQQQRVALARAIAIRPKVLLMDEPLSNLDAKLRIQMRTIIRKIQKELGITTIYVTHDQEEALAISDRIAVIKDGIIQQIDEPTVIYKRPANKFVATFIGTSNILEAMLTVENDIPYIHLTEGSRLPIANVQLQPGKVILGIRPEEFKIGSNEVGVRGTIKFSTFLGDFVNYEIELANGKLVEANEYRYDVDIIRQVGDTVNLGLLANKINVFDAQGNKTLMLLEQEERL